MPDEKTLVTEVVTGLGMSGHASLDRALFGLPAAFAGLDMRARVQLMHARVAGRHAALFDLAWANGRAFLEANDGLRLRTPLLIEWKGPHKPPGYESLPADLRVDHVYLVSCKYGSDISTNCSPSNLFDRLLAQRTSGSEPWYGVVAPDAYAAFYGEVRRFLGGLPESVHALTPDDIALIRATCGGRWPEPLLGPWRAFSFEVATATAERWRRHLVSPAMRELQLWRLLRLESSPYFVLGATKGGVPLRYRVATPWDWRQGFRLLTFDVEAVPAGQPLVRWTATVRDEHAGSDLVVFGEVEIRWSHGRFSAVEAKLHLKTPPLEVPGYFSLV
jgi:hypothetical protein